MRSIGNWCFYASGLEAFTCPASMTELGHDVFGRCEGLAFVRMNDNLAAVPEGCFKASRVREVVLPRNLERIEAKAFEGCGALERLTTGDAPSDGKDGAVLPRSLREIGRKAFHQCTSLTHIVLNEGLETLGEWAFAESGLRCLKLPSTVREMGKGAFCKCEDLRTVELQEGLERIAEYCFSGVRAEEIVVPRSVRRIEKNAFLSSVSLFYLYFAPGSRLEEVEKYAFGNTRLVDNNPAFPAGARVSEEVFDCEYVSEES